METHFVYPVCNLVQRITLRLFADWEVAGREHVPPMGPLIVVANHQSNLDPPLLGASFPRRLWYLAKDNMFRGPIGTWFFRSYGAFPLNRSGADIAAYRWALRQLDRGQAVVIFPEGTRSPGSLGKAQTGVVRLALKSGAPLLPVGITGTERLGGYMRVLNPTGRIRVNIGTAFSMPSIEGRLNPEALESLTDTIMWRLAALLPESYQGAYRVGPKSGVAAPGRPGQDIRNTETPSR